MPVTLTFAAALASAGIDPADALVIRHAYVREHEDGTIGIHGDSSETEILAYTESSRLTHAPSRRTLPAPGSSSCPRAAIALGCGRSWRTAAKSRTTGSAGPSSWNQPS